MVERHYIFKYFELDISQIPFPTKVNLENEVDFYSACSNPTSGVLGIIIGKGA